jgi:hypothetical protein
MAIAGYFKKAVSLGSCPVRATTAMAMARVAGSATAFTLHCFVGEHGSI